MGQELWEVARRPLEADLQRPGIERPDANRLGRGVAFGIGPGAFDDIQQQRSRCLSRHP